MKKLLLLFLLISTGFQSFAQAVSLPYNILNKYFTDYPNEKVFLQTDRESYVSGETIWMKAWCLAEGKPTFLSSILYVDLVNQQGEVVQKRMYNLDSLGSTAGDIDLSPTIASGNYSINAYTLWMQNFTGFVFHKEISIYGKNYKPDPQKSSGSKLSVQFFPEGGDMVEGLSNKIAFKATVNFMPAEVKGFVTDEQGNRVADLVSEHFGMGVFDLKIEPGKKYIANIPSSSGSMLLFNLPAPKAEGIILKIENSKPNKLFIAVDRSPNQKEHYSKIKIVAHGNSEVLFEANLDIDKKQNAFSIEKKTLPAGITHITAFDINNNPLAERLVFINNYEILKPVIKVDNIDFKTKSTSNFTVSLPQAGKMALSVVVIKANAYKQTLKNNIASSLLLTSDLKGYIHEPDYYFQDREPARLQHLDLLLLTHGWRRFEWKKLLANKFPAIKYPVETALWISGKLMKRGRKESLTDARISFIIKGEDSTNILAESTVNANDEFLVTDLAFRKKATISFNATNNKKENAIADVQINPTYYDTLKQSSNVPMYCLI